MHRKIFPATQAPTQPLPPHPPTKTPTVPIPAHHQKEHDLLYDGSFLFSPVDFKSNPEISCLNRQYKPLDKKFSALYDGISCQSVGVEQFSQPKKL